MNNVTTLVQANANVVAVKELNVGDFYRRLKKDYSDTYKPQIGKVIDIVFNGEDAIVYAIEVEESYSLTKAAEVTFNSKDKDGLTLFIGNEDDFKTQIELAIKKNDKEISDNQTKIEEIKSHTTRLKSLIK